MNNVKVCIKCDESKPFTKEYFVVDNKRKAGLRETCKDCRNNQTRDWYDKAYQKNKYKEKRLRLNREYKQRMSENLTDTFIKYRLCLQSHKQGINLRHEDVNDSTLIKSKQKQLCLLRKTKQLKQKT